MYCKACTKYFPVLLCTTKFGQSSSQFSVITTKLGQISSKYYVLQSLHNIFPSTTFVLQSQGLHNTIYFRAIPSSPASPASPWRSNFDGSLQSLAWKSGTASTKAGLQSQAWKQPVQEQNASLDRQTQRHSASNHLIDLQNQRLWDASEICSHPQRHLAEVRRWIIDISINPPWNFNMRLFAWTYHNPYRIHGAGIYIYILTFGVYWWDPCYHI